MKMIVQVYKTFEVEYYGEQYREHAINCLQVSGIESEGAGPDGTHKTKEITYGKHPAATFAITVISDSK